MALPLIPAAGGILKGTGALAVGRGALSSLRGAAPRLRSAAGSLPQSTRTWLGIGGGATGGYAGASIMNRLGIEDERTQKLAILGAALVAVVGVGQLVDLNVDL